MTHYATIPADRGLRPERLEGPISYRQRVFLATDERHAVAVAQADAAQPQLTVAVAKIDDHPFDFAPARLDRERVRELRDALTEWLERTP